MVKKSKKQKGVHTTIKWTRGGCTTMVVVPMQAFPGAAGAHLRPSFLFYDPTLVVNVEKQKNIGGNCMPNLIYPTLPSQTATAIIYPPQY